MKFKTTQGIIQWLTPIVAFMKTAVSEGNKEINREPFFTTF